LSVWQEAIRFADLVYELTGDFPGEERFGLTNQMRCAAVSISSNIAEGSSGASRTDFARCVMPHARSRIGSSTVVIVPVAPLLLRNSKHASLPPSLPMREHGQL
jgi:hypothetical protein